MSFKEQLKNDALLIFLNTNEFSESIKYTPYGSAQKTISAIVDRQPNDPMAETSNREIAHQMEIRISNDPSYGISTINRGGDKVLLPAVSGSAEKEFIVVDILGSDEAMWHLLIQR